MNQRITDICRFYDLLDVLQHRFGGARSLATSSGKLDWPKRGVYFFLENGEGRSQSGDGARVVRIGTHALKTGASTTIWHRLRGHRGSARSGGGNHRGSSFRLDVGTAMMGRDDDACPTWYDRRSDAPREVRDAEQRMESRVSEVIGAMPFLWLPAEDDAGPHSERGLIERGAIALLSNWKKDPIDPPSADWLGLHCNRTRVRDSGLWNSNHIDEAYEPAFLDVFERLVNDARVSR